METPTHVIDPDGEIIIVLKDANPPFSVWVENCEDETGTGVKNGEGNGNGEKPDQSTGDQQPATDDVVKEDVKEETFRILVSAKHLTLASPVWKKMFTGSWKESAVLLQNGSIELTVYSWDLEALLLLLNIIHCKHQALPPSPDLKLLARMGIIADYYACSDAVKFMVKAWIGPFTSPPPSSQEEVMLWIWISWAFELSSDFTASTSFHLTHAKTPIKNLGIPIPSNIIDAINQQREQAIQKILDNLQSTRNGLFSEATGCNFSCRSLRLGGLELHMRSKNLLSPEPVAPFSGLSYFHLVKDVNNFQIPDLYTRCCTYSKRGPNYFNFKDKDVNGLELSLFKSE